MRMTKDLWNSRDAPFISTFSRDQNLSNKTTISLLSDMINHMKFFAIFFHTSFDV